MNKNKSGDLPTPRTLTSSPTRKYRKRATNTVTKRALSTRRRRKIGTSTMPSQISSTPVRKVFKPKRIGPLFLGLPVIEFDENRQYSWRIFAEDLLAGRLDLSKLVERYNMQTREGLDARLAVSRTLGALSFRKQGFSPRARWENECKRVDSKRRVLGKPPCIILSGRNTKREPKGYNNGKQLAVD